MPAKSVKAKKAPAKKKATPVKAKKAPASAVKLKAKAKPAPAPKAAAGKGFMWKLLEQKERKQKEMAEQQSQANPHSREHGFHPHERGPAFAKFQGPRRRAG